MLGRLKYRLIPATSGYERLRAAKGKEGVDNRLRTRGTPLVLTLTKPTKPPIPFREGCLASAREGFCQYCRWLPMVRSAINRKLDGN